MREVDAHSLRLDTALVFDEIRTMATADERQRLAREIHDGIAQEVASLGYVVDHLASTTRDPDVAQGLRDLRGELTRVVADLRLSIFDLRSDVSATNGLGAALSDYVRQVGAKSDLTVHLTLNEAPTRLSPAVEAELLRIAQEAITNARKHASAHNLWVDCWTDPPRASLTVRDDGARHRRTPRRLLRHLDHARARRAHRRHARRSASESTMPTHRAGRSYRLRWPGKSSSLTRRPPGR